MQVASIRKCNPTAGHPPDDCTAFVSPVDSTLLAYWRKLLFTEVRGTGILRSSLRHGSPLFYPSLTEGLRPFNTGAWASV